MYVCTCCQIRFGFKLGPSFHWALSYQVRPINRGLRATPESDAKIVIRNADQKKSLKVGRSAQVPASTSSKTLAHLLRHPSSYNSPIQRRFLRLRQMPLIHWSVTLTLLILGFLLISLRIDSFRSALSVSDSELKVSIRVLFNFLIVVLIVISKF